MSRLIDIDQFIKLKQDRDKSFKEVGELYGYEIDFNQKSRHSEMLDQDLCDAINAYLVPLLKELKSFRSLKKPPCMVCKRNKEKLELMKAAERYIRLSNPDYNLLSDLRKWRDSCEK